MIGTFVSGDLRSVEGQTQLLTGLGVVFSGATIAAIAGWFIVRYLGGATAIQRLVLEDTLPTHTPHSDKTKPVAGTTGVAITDLRPSGRIQVNGTVLDATTTGQWISQGATVRIMHTGMILEVEEIKA